MRRESGGSGGAERVASRFAKHFSDKWEVTLLNAGMEHNGKRIPGDQGSSWLRAWKFASAVTAILRRDKPDMVLSLERGTPCDVYRAGDGVHRRWLEIRFGRSSGFFGNPLHYVSPMLEKRTINWARTVVPNSEMVRTDLERFYPQQARKFQTIHNGFEPERFHPVDEATRQALRTSLGLDCSGRVILFCGSGWERKGLDVALDFTARASKVTRDDASKPVLVVAGPGKQERYRPLIKKLGLTERVRFIGAVPDSAPYMQAADIFVLPTQYDPFSNATLEALACGCPVVTTGENGVAEVIEQGETGYVLRTGQSQELREAVSWWLRSTLDRERVASSVAHMTTENEIARYEKLFEQILERKQKR